MATADEIKKMQADALHAGEVAKKLALDQKAMLTTRLAEFRKQKAALEEVIRKAESELASLA